MAVLTYDDIYVICEELGQLLGGRVQKVFSSKLLRYELEIYKGGQSSQSLSRYLVFDLKPARPLILSTELTPAKKVKHKSPVFNFLNAHFLNSQLRKIEVAEKPNRILRLEFQTLEQTRTLTFKCYPHGQEIFLEANGKHVVCPLRRLSEGEEATSYVEPEIVFSWLTNSRIETSTESDEADDLKTGKSSSTKKENQDYSFRLKKKLERAISNIDSTFSVQRSADQEEIIKLENEAVLLQQQEVVSGVDLNALYERVKKLKRKSELTTSRRTELQKQLDYLETEEGQKQFSDVRKPESALKKSQDERNLFSGTRVRIDSHFELWVGRTAWQNDDLVRLASPHEIWIHLRDYAGAHGLIRGPKKSEPPQALIEFSCRIVGQLSQSKKHPFSEGQPLDFIVTPKKFVRKLKGSAPGKVVVERESVRRIAFRTVKFEVIT